MQRPDRSSRVAAAPPGPQILRRRAEDGSVVALVRYPAGMESPEHGHDALSLSMVLRGSVLEEVGAVRVVGAPLQAVVKPAATLHENRFGPGGAVMIQILPSDEVLGRAAESGPAFGHWSWTDTALPAPWIALARALLAGADAAALADRIAEAIGAAAPQRAGGRTGSPPAWLREVRDRLADAAGAPVSLAGLAAEHSVHRVHLARAFREHFGATPSEFRLRRRVGEAARLLAGDPEDRAIGGPLASTACRAGFSDQAHMTREFGRWLGLTPARYRDLAL